MKVAFIDCLHGSGREGGADIATAELARHLGRTGIEVEMLSFQDGIPMALPRFLKTKPLVREVAAFPLAGRKAMKLAEGRCDIIHLNSLALAPIYRACRPVVVTLHNIQTQKFKAQMRKRHVPLVYNPATLIPFEYLEKKALRNIDYFIAITQSIADFLKDEFQVPGSRIIRIPNGVDCDLFRPSTRQRKQVIFVGRATLPKGFYTLLEAAPSIKAPILAIVSKIRKTTASQAHKKRVELRYRVPHEELAPLLAGSSILVLPSRDEEQSLVVLEAMACGLAVVTTPEGASDLIKDGENGAIVPPDDPKVLAESVNSLLDNAGLAESMGEANRRKAEEEYAWPKISARVMEVYNRILQA